ncbi:MAG TPA: ribokinase [Gaiellaceae bacterium]|nr:ribokinase [Gaiellaceae bacterium]
MRKTTFALWLHNPAGMTVELTVIGSINVDYVARMERLPNPGETVAARQFERHPGGKGANQAVAAARLGAQVTMIGAVGEDEQAEFALGGLLEAGVELEVMRSGQTGVALIYVDMQGENEIAVFPGANASLAPRELEGAVLCQLEVPDEVVFAAAEKASFFALNAAPARELDLDPDLLVVNRFEYEVMKRGKLVAVTHGEDGAVLYENGKQVAGSAAPAIIPVDGTGAGDAFTAALVVSLLEGKPYEDALRFSCAAGARTAATFGAQQSLPDRELLEGWIKNL